MNTCPALAPAAPAASAASAAPGTLRDFSSRHVATVLFDCPLWPSVDHEPHVLVSYMTGLIKPAHTASAQKLCRRELANQFPMLAMWSGSHLEVGTLHRHLALYAELRQKDLNHWLDELQHMARIDISHYQQDDELLYEWADRLDWHLLVNRDRGAALRSWFVSLCRYLVKGPVTLEEPILKALLRKLDTRFKVCEEQANHIHVNWLETRRCVAYLPEWVAVQRLPANTYTEQDFVVDQNLSPKYEETSIPLYNARCAWGRLEYFRAETQMRADFT